MTQRQTQRHLIGALIVLLTAGLVAGAAAPAAATHQDGDSAFDALFGDEEDDGYISMALAGASGLADRLAYAAPFGPEPTSAEESAEDAMEAFNANSEDFVDYANERDVNGAETVAVTFVQGGEEATVVLVADYNETAEAYEGAEVVTAADYDGDVGETDEWVDLEGMAADNAADEIERFHDEFAADGDNVTASYMSEMAAKYGGKGPVGQLVDSSILED